ncbi:transglycosylase domain-containing protein [Notoacmeibacter ruber]|uniref:PBP1A family penicillin-binding protein n=1 Tax=Notoacmeibacter ruber TaxID=2670375 RepID=A0A3L7J9U4_9HYPH|nr:PBP1A family penicillin-binding protein [Notoacmeibacter ruber]RLQ87527.1 PBP1A family penicillin-binding protein [Notoacmeibacter ruber]
MKEPQQRKKPRFRVSRLIGLDAWLDSSLYRLRFGLAEIWDRITIFSRKFRVSGWKRGAIELLSEGFTLGTVGVVLFYVLAIPAFRETEGNWRQQDGLAVTFLDRYGRNIGQRGAFQRDSVPVNQLPDYLVKAILATEDRRFFEHFGIDVMGIARAMMENARSGGVVQGGSTLTQQLAKNLFLSNERKLQRKIKEAYLALWLEENLTKREILQLYVDRVYMGGGVHGVSAAAEFYFGKDVREISLAEAAMLAGLFKAPSGYAPHVNLPAARARANEVLTNLVQADFMTEGQVSSARLQPASAIERDANDSPDYYLDWAFEQVQKIADTLPSRNLVVRTAFDPTLQRASEESCEFHLRQFGKSYNVEECAVVVMEPNGLVRAMVGGPDYGKSQFNRAVNAERQPGSSFKPYVYAAAIRGGMKASSRVSDSPINWNGWSPQNYNRDFRGRTDLQTALIKSINTVPAHLARNYIKGGVDTVADLVEDMGIETPVLRHKTMVLGAGSITVLDQATGYSVFASGGILYGHHAFTQILDQSGEVIWRLNNQTSNAKRVLSEEVAGELNKILVQIPEWGTARRAALEGIPSAGKTGTTQSYRDGWYVGYTGNYVAAVWLGNDDYRPTNRMTGGSLPALVWNRLMRVAHQNVRLKPIPGAERPVAETVQIAAEEGEEVSPVTNAPRGLMPELQDALTALGQLFDTATPLQPPLADSQLRASR